MKKKLKIGVVIDQLLPGGVQIAAIEEVKNLRLLGHRAELLILMRKKYSFQFEYLVKSIPHRYLSDSYSWPFRATIKFPIFAFFSTLHLLSPFLAPRVIKEKSYDFLISHGTTTCFTTLALWRRKRIPYIAVIHDPMAFILKNVYSNTVLRLLFPILIPLSFYLEKAFVKEALSTTIVSGFHRKFIQDKYRVDPIILPHGCNAAREIPGKRGESILALSRWQKEKHPEFLLEILRELPGAKMIIAGVWTRNWDIEEFKQLVKKLGLQKRVKIISQFKVSDLPNLFRQARVWVHPHFEAFGMGGLEAERVLKSKGYLFLVTPNLWSLMKVFKKNNWFAYTDPTHIQFYNPLSLRKLLEKHGFKNFCFRFKVDPKTPADWCFASPRLTQSLQFVANFLLLSTPISYFRDSFWVLCQKKD